MKITAGASRKLNRQAYGGKAYESEDVWVSMEVEKEIDINDKVKVKTATAELSLDVQDVLGKLVERRIADIMGTN